MRITRIPPPHVPDVPEVAKLDAFMQGKDEATFDELRAGIVGWGAFTDGQVQQHVQDSGDFKTHSS